MFIERCNLVIVINFNITYAQMNRFKYTLYNSSRKFRKTRDKDFIKSDNFLAKNLALYFYQITYSKFKL